MTAMAMMMLAIFQPMSVYAGDFSTASTLPLDGKWSDKCLLQEKATDYYKFTISTAGIVNIKLMAYTDCMAYYVYNSEYNMVGFECRAYNGSENSPEVGAEQYCLSQGTYYVAVKKYAGNEEGNYRLNASFSSYGITASENDSFDTPLSMSVNKKVTGVLTQTNGVDWYKIRIPAAGSYKLIFEISNSSLADCEFYDSNLSLLEYTSGVSSKELNLSAGTYYIKIKSYYEFKYTCQINELIPKKGDMLTDTKTQALKQYIKN